MKEEIKEAVKLFGREDLFGDFGIQDTDTNIEVFMAVKDMIKYYRQEKEIERLINGIEEIRDYIYENGFYYDSDEGAVPNEMNIYDIAHVVGELNKLIRRGDKE